MTLLVDNPLVDICCVDSPLVDAPLVDISLIDAPLVDISLVDAILLMRTFGFQSLGHPCINDHEKRERLLSPEDFIKLFPL